MSIIKFAEEPILKYRNHDCTPEIGSRIVGTKAASER